MTCLLVEDLFNIENLGIVFIGTADGKFLNNSDVFFVTRNEVMQQKLAGIEKNKKLVDECNRGDSVGLLFRIHDIEKFDSLKSAYDSLRPGYQIVITNEISTVDQIRHEHSDLFESDDEFYGRIYSLTVDAVEKYKEVLAKKYWQLTYVDDYDEVVIDDFEKEVRQFCTKKLGHLKNALPLGIEIAKKYILSIKDEFKDGLTLVECDSPYDYEKLVGESLEKLGWKSRTTPKTGDQGADVISEKDGIVLVVQCKKYSGTVGNKAIQEVYSAKGFYGADYAAVVTSSSFSKSAKQLADIS